MLEVKSSSGKHESDIPAFDMANTLSDFFTYRQEITHTLKLMDNTPLSPEYLGENAILPTLLAALAEPSLQSVPKQTVELVFALEKKFVLFGTLSTHYSFDYKPVREQYNCPDVYSSLAAILLRYFFECNDFNALNSAIRLVDTVCRQVKENISISQISQLINVLAEEKRAIMELSNA